MRPPKKQIPISLITTFIQRMVFKFLWGVVLLMLITPSLPAQPLSIKSRISTRQLTTPYPLERAEATFNMYELTSTTPRLYLESLTASTNILGWTDDSTNGHVSRIVGMALESIVDFAGRKVRGLVVHEDGTFAVLLWEPAAETMWLSKRSSGGAEIWARNLNTGLAVPAGSLLGESRLGYGGGRYAAYYAAYGVSDFATGHYGEQLTYVNDAGEIMTGGFDWGLSHSMSGVATYHPEFDELLVVGSSDCYPQKGIIANARKVLFLSDGNCAGKVYAQVGSLVVSTSRWILAFNAAQTPTVPEGKGVGILTFDMTFVPSVKWITATDGSEERDPVLARAGIGPEKFLLGWRVKNTQTFMMAVLDDSLNIVEIPEEVSSAGVGWGLRDDSFRSQSDGSVHWAAGTERSTTLKLHRFTLQPLQPCIRSVVIEGGQQCTLTWSAEPGISYRLQYRTNLTNSGWTDIAGDVTASGSTATKTDTVTGETQRFYRVRRL